MTMHYRPARTTGTACGRGGSYPITTADTTRVRCGACLRTAAFKRVANVARITVLATAMTEDGLTPEQQAVKAALDAVFNRAHAEAEDQGVCSTYDRIIDEVRDDLPSWYTMPEPAQNWMLSISRSYLNDECRSLDDAYTFIAENVRDYVSLESFR